MVQPYGAGLIPEDEVNWSHKASFGTTAYVSAPGTLNFRGTGWNTGNMDYSDGPRVGDSGDWESGDWARLDLGVARDINRVVLDWNDGWWAEDYVLSYASDLNGPYTPVTFTSGPTELLANQAAASGATFDTVNARYWQLTDLSGGNGAYSLVQQVMLYGPAPSQVVTTAIPEPTSLALLGVPVAVLGLRRRRQG